MSNFILFIISQIKILFNKRSLNNIRKRYEYYKEIITNIDNKVLAYTGLKEYLGFSISDRFAEHILTSTKFYDIVTVLIATKDTDLDFNSTTNKIEHKENNKLKSKRTLFTFLFCLFLLPLILLSSFYHIIKDQYDKYLIVLMVLPVIIFTILAIFFAVEASKKTLVINLLKKSDNE